MEKIYISEQELLTSKNYFRMKSILFIVLLFIFSSQIIAFTIGGFVFSFSGIIELFSAFSVANDASYISIILEIIFSSIRFLGGLFLMCIGFSIFLFFIKESITAFSYFKLVSNPDCSFYKKNAREILPSDYIIKKRKTKITISIYDFSKKIKVNLKNNHSFPDFLIILYDGKKNLRCCNFEYLGTNFNFNKNIENEFK